LLLGTLLSEHLILIRISLPYFARGKFEVAEVMLAMRIVVRRELVEVTNSLKYLGESSWQGGYPWASSQAGRSTALLH
jgi:hypothetical protein